MWKSKYEEDTNTSLAKATGRKGTTDYYYCNRSGYFNTKSKGLRNIKSQGSNKLDTYCTASITVTTDILTGQLTATICHTHYGHSIQLGHVPLPTSTRMEVAAKLMQGVSTDHILDTIRDNMGDKVNRIHLLTRKDIRNIEHTFGIKSIERHSDDAKSVALWVAEMQLKPSSNPVILYKPQGTAQPNECDNLTDDDFVIALQTPLQAEMLKQFGHERTICIDSTFGTTGYNFTLITVIVIDEYGEGYPVAWCLSNREDQFLLENFFRAIQVKCGHIEPKWFMTDDAEQFYKAWASVFGKTTKTSKLLCTWHIDRAWRGQLHQITDKKLQQTVYHNLQLLLDETDRNTFEDLLQRTLNQMKTSTITRSFYQYFLCLCYC